MSKNKISSQTTSKEILNILKEVSKLKKEFSKSQKEFSKYRKETNRKIKELSKSKKESPKSRKKTDHHTKELSEHEKEMARHREENDRRLEKLGIYPDDPCEKLIETLVKGDIHKLLKQRKMKINGTSKETIFTDLKGERQSFDMMAISYKEVVIFDVRTKLKMYDVKCFIDKIKDFKKICETYKNHKMYGGVVYLKASHASSKYARKKRLFVIKGTENSASIINRGNFKPKEF